LGIQMYQSPVNAIAELVANAWDADAELVKIDLPTALGEEAELRISDDGIGMTFDDCEQRYLNVGWNRRAGDPQAVSLEKKRPVLGRKGIGKFAGFGIAQKMRVETISKMTGEKTIFELDVDELLGEKYAIGGKEIEVIEFAPPNEDAKTAHGTSIILTGLSLGRVLGSDEFARSMARRFLLHQEQADFKVNVDGHDLPDSMDLIGVQFSFPRDYEDDERPANLKEVDAAGWGEESLQDGTVIRWRFMFFKETIDEEDFRGVSIFANGKLAQAPFLFNLTGGLGGQHGAEYLAGQVKADFVDRMAVDAIATERQRINWELPQTAALRDWGRDRVKQQLKLWQARRGKERAELLEKKLAGFSGRLEALEPHERKTVTSALRKLAGIATLKDSQFEELGEALLTAWEEGRLHELIAGIAAVDEMSEEELLSILVEARVLAALNTAEAVKTKLLVVGGLKQRVQKKQLENAVRDYIANNPWLIEAKWETFTPEKSVRKLVESIANDVGFTDPAYNGRVDLVLSSGRQLLVLEFMRPGLSLDWDHIQRYEQYILKIRAVVAANTGGPFNDVIGYLVADGAVKRPEDIEKIRQMQTNHMYAMDWETLFQNALSGWRGFLFTLAGRAPEDQRLQALMEEG